MAKMWSLGVFNYIHTLTLKMPRKPASENVICLCGMLNILANFQNYFCIQANSVEADQIAKMTFKITSR